MINNQEEPEQITKEFIDKELMEKSLVDQKILDVLDNIQFFLILGLVCLMIYITFQKVKAYLKKKRKEQEELLDSKQRELMRNYHQNQKEDIEE